MMRRVVIAVVALLVLSGCGAKGSEQTEAERRAEAVADGKVALCNDGNFSDNHDLTATCSGGDGIDEWLAKYGECDDGKIVKLKDSACGFSTDLKRLKPAYKPPTAAEKRATALQDGAVALCNDGNYSDNHDLTATCSGGDGIDEWLAKYGECADGEIVLLAEDACGYGNNLKRLMPEGYTPPTTTLPPTTTAPPTTVAPTLPLAATPPPTAPPATAPPATAPPATTPPASSSSYYENCAAARAAGVAPLYRGDPGYASHLDRDNDGIACE